MHRCSIARTMPKGLQIFNAFREGNTSLVNRSFGISLFKALSTGDISGKQDGGITPRESFDDIEQRMFGETPRSRSTAGPIFGSGSNESSISHKADARDGQFSSLSDGLDGKLKQAASDFKWNPSEMSHSGSSIGPDSKPKPGANREIKDLDVMRFRPNTPPAYVINVTTEETLRKADFRNVRFLANFLTEAGTILKRNKSGISAKAQRKISREIKTARAFGLMPFTSMGNKPFAFGKNMEALEEDFQYQSFGNFMDDAEDDRAGE